MRIKIGDTWYDSEDVPICVEFNPYEVQMMNDAEDNRIGTFPTGWDFTQMNEWMENLKLKKAVRADANNLPTGLKEKETDES